MTRIKIVIAVFIITGLTSCYKAPVPNPIILKDILVPAQGQDYYALQSRYWNVKSTISYTPTNIALGSLHTTFGTSLIPINSLVSAVHPSYYRVHIINGTCIRNGNCGRYEIGYGYSKSSFDAAVRVKKSSIFRPFQEQVKAYCDLFSHFPDTRFIISPELEHDLSIQSWRNLADATLTMCPNVQLSDSPDGGIKIERYRGAWVERHGNTPQSDADIVSLDGADATQIDINAYLQRVSRLPSVKINYLWTAGYNCRIGTWQDPRNRKNCSSSKTLELMNHITDKHLSPPPFTGSQCSRISPFKSPDIWKPLAESQVNYDPRQELPVLITKGFKPNGNINVLASTGNRVGYLGYYGSYLSQGWRWYSGYSGGSRGSGYEFQKGASANNGSAYLWLQQSRTCKGPLLTGQRQGLMRDK